MYRGRFNFQLSNSTNPTCQVNKVATAKLINFARINDKAAEKSALETFVSTSPFPRCAHWLGWRTHHCAMSPCHRTEHQLVTCRSGSTPSIAGQIRSPPYKKRREAVKLTKALNAKTKKLSSKQGGEKREGWERNIHSDRLTPCVRLNSGN